MVQALHAAGVDGKRERIEAVIRLTDRYLRHAIRRTRYRRVLAFQSEEAMKASYSAGEIDRLEYRQAITNMSVSCCQSLRTTSQSKMPPELTDIVRISPGFGIASSSTRLQNRTSLLAMVSGDSFPSRRTRREGILRLISTVCAI